MSCWPIPSGSVLALESGTGRARFWSQWVQPSTGSASVRVVWPGGVGGSPSTGVVLEAYEYQRYQTGAQPFWTPLHFPGQYHDTETDLFENWNRYYDPSIGRYLQPEPILQKPAIVRDYARQSRMLTPYAYGLNNPLHFADKDGFLPDDDVLGRRNQFSPELLAAHDWGAGMAIVATGAFFASYFALEWIGATLIPSVATCGANSATKVPIEPNKLNHIFGKAEHALDAAGVPIGTSLFPNFPTSAALRVPWGSKYYEVPKNGAFNLFAHSELLQFEVTRPRCGMVTCAGFE